MSTDNDLQFSSDGMRKNPNMAASSTGGVYGATDSYILGDRDDADINDDAIDTLSNLLETCRDGEYGFTECAGHVQAPQVKTVFMQRAGDCRTAAAELQQLIVQLGGEPDDSGSMGGALHRGWVSVKGTLSGYSDISMLEECERAEDVALAQYRKALKKNLPPNIKTVVERQAQGTQTNHDQIRDMRDAYKADRQNA